MKRIILIAIGLISFLFCKAQTISYNDLKFVLYHNLDETQDFLLKRGIGFNSVDTLYNNKIDSLDVGFTFERLFKYSQTKFETNRVVVKLAHNNKFFCAQFYTEFSNDYIFFKSSIKKLGFKMVSTDTEYMREKTLIIQYKKGHIEVSFSIWRDSKTQMSKYNIDLTDKLLKDEAWN